MGIDKTVEVDGEDIEIDIGVDRPGSDGSLMPWIWSVVHVLSCRFFLDYAWRLEIRSRYEFNSKDEI